MKKQTSDTIRAWSAAAAILDGRYPRSELDAIIATAEETIFSLFASVTLANPVKASVLLNESLKRVDERLASIRSLGD